MSSWYQKYRPNTLDDLVGQDFVKATLTAAFQAEQMPHAYLFYGSRGTGKTSTARIMAKTLLLRGLDETKQNQITELIKNNTCTDLIEIDGASNRRIEDARDLIEKIKFAPSQSKVKVYIIDEVHMLTKEAFNALLKTIEEPPSHAYFILATTELHKVPATIVSRCQVFAFARLTPEQIVGRLQYILEQEQVTVDDGVLELIAERAAGGLRDGISLLQQAVSSGCTTVQALQEHLGLTQRSEIEALVKQIREGQAEAALNLIKKSYNQGADLQLFCIQILEVLAEQLQQATLSADKPAIKTTLNLLETFEQARRQLKTTAIPTLPLEVAIASSLSNMS